MYISIAGIQMGSGSGKSYRGPIECAAKFSLIRKPEGAVNVRQIDR